MRDLGEVPSDMRRRPLDHRGYPVPWFVTEKTDDGLWNFSVVTPERVDQALKSRLCWVSGEPLGAYASFVIGPMCVVNRIATDPPARKSVAEWSARVCPFLTRPLAKRPSVPDSHDTPGVMVPDNPGICVVWTTKTWKRDRQGLIHLGDPVSVAWWREGRLATQDEIDTIFWQRVQTLRDMAAEEGPVSQVCLEQTIRISEPWRVASR